MLVKIVAANPAMPILVHFRPSAKALSFRCQFCEVDARFALRGRPSKRKFAERNLIDCKVRFPGRHKSQWMASSRHDSLSSDGLVIVVDVVFSFGQGEAFRNCCRARQLFQFQ
jgi:hypothetical protein